MLGKNLKRKRLEKGLSQKELARRLDWGEGNSRISQYENGAREPTLKDITDIARALDTTLLTLLLDDGSLPPGVTAEEIATLLGAFFSRTKGARKEIIGFLGLGLNDSAADS